MRLAAGLCAAVLCATGAAADGLPPLPFEIGGAFELDASDGTTRTERDPDGRHQLLFFGYASCAQICSAVLPTMAEVTADLASRDLDLRPVIVTIDPENDTPDVMAEALARHHPDFVGLTGDPGALQQAYDAFQIEREFLFTGPDGVDVYAHTSFVFLLSPEGEVLTVIPPILSEEQTAEIVARYLGGA